MSKEGCSCESFSGAVSDRRTTPLEEAYAHFRLDRQGLPVSPATLRLYEHTIGRFLRWVRSEHPDVRRFEELDVVVVREYRAALAARPGLRGKPIQPETLSGSDRALRTFFRWASAEGYPVAERILTLPKVRVPWKEPTLFHIRQQREILAACNPQLSRRRWRGGCWSAPASAGWSWAACPSGARTACRT